MKIATEFNQQVDERHLDDFIVKVYAGHGRCLVSQHLVGPVKGRPTEITYKYVDVWVIRDGRWQCVASQSTEGRRRRRRRLRDCPGLTFLYTASSLPTFDMCAPEGELCTYGI